jgi:FAD/FMN-containing dehydrogenase
VNKRNFVRFGAAIPLLSMLPRRLLARTAASSLTMRRVRPGDPGWPTAASWQKLNDAVGGNLLQVQPLFGGCEKDPQGAACQDALKHIGNPFYIGDQPGGTEVSGWLDAWTPAPSAYALAARNAQDVARGVNFARENKLRLVVKGGGHSYLGTSNAPDSLLIWTRRMNKVTLHDRFVAQGCKSVPMPAVTAETGAMWIDMYHAVTTQAGRYVQGGGCASVNVGGLIQSGGFGSFSKGFGTAASGLLEAEVVTADGVVRTVNPCMHPDLFWAIKGGGGGSWGVLTKVTLRTHDLPEFFGGAIGMIKARSDEAFRKLIAHFVDFYAESLLNPHWGEQVSFGSDNSMKISMVCQGLDSQQPKQIWQPLFDWVGGAPSEFSVVGELRAGALPARNWWAAEGNPFMVRDPRDGVPVYRGWWKGDQDQVGAFLHGYDSLWLPASLLQKSERARLSETFFAASRKKNFGLHFNKGLAGAPPEARAAARQTATNPSAADAFALAIIADGGRPQYPALARPPLDKDAARRDAHDIADAAAELRRIAPNGGSYVSESNYFNRAWQKEYWGEANYRRLQAVKKKYDPDGLFFVHNGVGSEEWSEDGFTRVSRR